jgi:SNF2 family DNA or RNA helicase
VREFKPRDYQTAIMRFVAEHERCNVWSGMGTGKSVSTLTILQGLALVEDPFPALVLAPLRVAQSTWPDEAQKWAHLNGLSIGAACGDAPFRRGVLRRRHDIVTTNYDNLPWLAEEVKDGWPFRTVVADEATRLKSFRVLQGGIRARALGRVAHKHVRRWVNLTGSPAPNGLLDLWGQQWFIDAGVRLGRSFSAYQNRWFKTQRAPGQAFGGVTTPLPGAEDEIYRLLADCTITVRAADYLDLPPLIENVIEVAMPAKARALYKELEREMFLKLDTGAEVEAFNAASLTMKCLQLANGALYTDADGTFEEIHDAKIQALHSVVEEAAGAPVLVAYHFKSDLARLRRALPMGRWLDADPQTIRDWNEGKIPVLFAHPASAGHGISLQDGGNIIVFFGLWWDLEQHEQIIERIGPTRQAQSGYNRPVFVHRLITKGTVDKLVLARLQTKASVQSLLLDAMKEQR